MDLTPEQDAAVRKWAAEGESVGEIRRRIKDEFGIPCTFLETRLYLIDHTVDMVDKSAPAEKEKPAEEPAPAEADDAPAAGGVSVSADTVVPPGALAAGTATFSDGETGRWYLDNYGRMGFESFSKPGYRPSPGDMELFKQRLMELLQSRGLM